MSQKGHSRWVSLLRNFLSLLAVGLLASCGPTVQTSVVPIVNNSGELVCLEPSGVKINESTRKSDVLRLNEDVIKAMPDNFPSNLIGLDPDKGEVVVGALAFVLADVQEKGKSSRTGVIIPVGAIEHLNVPQERIDALVPKVQNAYLQQLRKRGRLIPFSSLEERKQ